MPPEGKYHRVNAEISWLVKQFETIDYKDHDRIFDKFIPRQDASIVFHFKGRPKLMDPVNSVMPACFVVPPRQKASMICLDEPFETFIATCHPTVLSSVFGLDLAKAGDGFITLTDGLFGSLWERLSECRSAGERIAYFTSFVMDATGGKYEPDDTDMYYEIIVRRCLTTPLREIIEDFNMSERTIQRRFRHRVGISPKALVRVVRINYLWGLINAKGSIDYQDIVFEGSYFDQTHFIKDFKAITGETPGFFFKRNLSTVKVLSGNN
ncbi:MAG: helix-turn-helix domain-containing protein [Bacteroidales bacterium]|jgi:AraC-like DNA-binding protein|nr:helix-turn-helix domain-containing protein [Bacteroidales bacterium]